jgi:adenylate cyclase, class 2
VREEIETRVVDAGAMRVMLERLGYEVVFRYEKYRAEFEMDGGMAVIDETPVGNFIELEGEAEWIDNRAEAMGFTSADYITLSYASLYLEWCARHGLEPGHMEFSSPKD